MRPHGVRIDSDAAPTQTRGRTAAPIQVVVLTRTSSRYAATREAYAVEDSEERLRTIASTLGQLLPSPTRRCLVIALDGIGHDDLLDAVATGVAPTLGTLIAGGASYAVASTYPPTSAVAWSSFMTACYPGKHGVFGFTHPEDGYTFRFTDVRDMRMPTLWDRAATDGLRSVIVNLPGTYPARKMSGSIVSGFVAPDLSRACYPRALGKRLASEGYAIDVDAALAHGHPDRFSTEVEEVVQRRIRAMESMLASERWSLAILAFTEANRMNRMWFRRIRLGDGLERDTYSRWFRQVDAFVDRCLVRYPGTHIVVMSPYGFGPLKRFVNLDAWLLANGYLNIDASGAITPDSRAFSMDPGRIYVASSQTFTRGVVPKADVMALVDEIADGLARLTDGDAARPVIASIRKRRDAYEGARTYQGPNLVCLPAPGYELKTSRRLPLFSDALFEGTHVQQGALVLATRTARAKSVTVEDVGATVLANLGLYDQDVDGVNLLA